MTERIDTIASREFVRLIRDHLNHEVIREAEFFTQDRLDESELRSCGAGPFLWDIVSEHQLSISSPDERLLSGLANAEAVYEKLRLKAISEVLGRCDSAGLKVILFKGSALAYSIYDRPYHRPRIDHDLLIQKSDFPRLSELLLELGYNRVATLTGSAVRNQAIFWKLDPWGSKQILDVHWELSERSILGFHTADFFEQVERFKSRDFSFWTFPHTTALLIACVHLRAHHPNEKRLLWYLDMVMLIRRMDQEALLLFINLSRDKGVDHYCMEALSECVRLFGLPRGFPAGYEQQLKAYAERGELDNRYQWQNTWQDCRGKSGLGKKILFLWQQVFPPLEYLQMKYGFQSKWQSPWYYLKRISGGFRFLFRKTG
ncbi:MAG: hypothetical protein CR997_13760 [Acidobacteria bacterium]|nr:MAG: hypothetical protein CR997_13760 [Acidobacteriota bacterium]